ncbi:MAG: ABC transporter permease, partial [Candidatus Omnitrophica bacterium]|nr:ABC transporter permease [Candidatus Omnitrophota bacterium]
MTSWTLVCRSLRHHARSHLGVLLGAAIGSAILVGALVVGDSVRVSLRDLALARLGKVQFALASRDRFFRTQLAGGLQSALPATAVAALQLPGIAVRADDTARANRVQVIGVDGSFWQLSPGPVDSPALPGDAVWLNRRLAGRLDARVGDTIVLRVTKPSLLSRDAPVSPQENASMAMRLVVRRILADSDLGNFSLQANQIPPFNAFVSLAGLQAKLDLAGRANLLMVGGAPGKKPGSLDAGAASQPPSLDSVAAALRAHWQLADAQLELRPLPAAGALELRTSRVFLDANVSRAALGIDAHAGGVLTYFANDLSTSRRACPYSIVTAMCAPVVPAGMRDDEILINQWLANDLKARPGSIISLKYYVVGTMRTLEERRQQFRVRAVLPMRGPAADRNLMPD